MNLNENVRLSTPSQNVCVFGTKFSIGFLLGQHNIHIRLNTEVRTLPLPWNDGTTEQVNPDELLSIVTKCAT